MRASSGNSRPRGRETPETPLSQAGFGSPLTHEAALLPVEIAQLLTPPEPPSRLTKSANHEGLLQTPSGVVSVVSLPFVCSAASICGFAQLLFHAASGR